MGRVLLQRSPTSLDQLLHTISIAHEYSSGSPSMSFEEETLDLQTKSSQPLEKSHGEEENMQDGLDLTSVETTSIKEIDFGVITSVVGGQNNNESCISPDITTSVILKPLAGSSNGEQTPANVTQEMQHSICLYEPLKMNEDVKSVCKEATSENKMGTVIKKKESGSPHKDQMNETAESRNRVGRPCKETKTMKNVSELGTPPKERMVEAMSNVSKRGRPRKERFSETIKNWNKRERTHKGKNSKTMKNIKKEVEAPKEMADGAMEEKAWMIEYPEKQQLNKTGKSSSIKRRGRPPKRRMTENRVDEEVVRNTLKRYVKKAGRPAKVRETIDNKTSLNGVGKQKNELSAVANKRLLMNQTDRVGQQNDEFAVAANKRSRIHRTDEVGQQSNEFSAGANKRLLLSQTDDAKSNVKKSTPQIETETPESLNFISSKTEKETPHNQDKIHSDISIPSGSQVKTIAPLMNTVDFNTELCPLNICRNTKLPFTKSSPLWEVLESSQVLTTMPQHPHFLPLKQYSQTYREGMAIGLTVTFTSIVHNVKNLSISDPDESVEQMTETLTDLERYGFSLYNLSDALQSVRTLKEDHKKLIDKISVTNEFISDRRSRREMLDEKLEAIRESIVGLEQTNKSLNDEKMALIEQMEEFDREILKLRSDTVEVEKSFVAAKSSLRCAPGSM